ncbi:hypothetical protein C8R48DRAFT_677849 [Suillus tomentosus]|nr:hypothetical protein C8R48DRAFT_677849 [Suillus tomentosus]
MAPMFPLALIQRFIISKSVDCTDLSASDQFLDAIIENSFVPLPRNGHIWRPCIVPVLDKSNKILVQSLNYNVFYSSSHPYSPPLSDVEEDETEHIIIKISYDLLALGNKSFKTPKTKQTMTSGGLKKGHRLRRLAALYHKGVKRSQDAYLRIPMEIIPNHHLELCCQDSSLMAFVSMALPNHICSALEVNLLSVLERPELLEEVDTQFPGCKHFQGNEASKEVQLWLLEKEDMHTNHHQMETFLQDEFEMLMEVVSVLPGNHSMPFTPFISLVININVRTKAHRDCQDHHLCLAIPIGHFQGGVLCLRENKLVLKLHSSNIAIFRSSEVTHFNLDYKGARASLIFQTDREFAAWVKNQNGWSSKPKEKGARIPQVSSTEEKEAELNYKENVWKKVTWNRHLPAQGQSVQEARLQTTSVVPDYSDIDHIDDANPADNLPVVVSPKKKVSTASLDFSDEDAENEADGDGNEADSDGNDEGSDVGKENESLGGTGVRRGTTGLFRSRMSPRKIMQNVNIGEELAKIALKTTFPGPLVDVQDSFAWDCIKEVVKNPSSPLKSMFDAISQDEAFKNCAMAYVWSGVSQLRGELVRKARENVAFLLQQMKPKDINRRGSYMAHFYQKGFFSVWRIGSEVNFSKEPDQKVYYIRICSRNSLTIFLLYWLQLLNVLSKNLRSWSFNEDTSTIC